MHLSNELSGWQQPFILLIEVIHRFNHFGLGGGLDVLRGFDIESSLSYIHSLSISYATAASIVNDSILPFLGVLHCLLNLILAYLFSQVYRRASKATLLESPVVLNLVFGKLEVVRDRANSHAIDNLISAADVLLLHREVVVSTQLV
mgnify:CR=1 FL=1